MQQHSPNRPVWARHFAVGANRRGLARLDRVDDPAIAGPDQPERPLPRLRARCLVANLRHEGGRAGAGRVGLRALDLHLTLIELKTLFLEFVESLVERTAGHTGPEVAHT